MSNLVQDELDRAKALLETSKSVIVNLAARVTELEKEVADHVSALLAKDTTIAGMTSSFHDRLSEFESFLSTWVVQPVEKVIEEVISPAAPVAEPVAEANAAPVANTTEPTLFGKVENAITEAVETVEKIVITPFK